MIAEQADRPRETVPIVDQLPDQTADTSRAPQRWRATLTRVTGTRRARTILAGYAVVLVAGFAYVLTRVLASTETPTVALVAAAVVAVPPIVALVGERITSIKISGLEVSLAAASVPTSTTIPTDELNSINASGGGDLGRQLRHLIGAPGSQLLELDLRDGNYWWPTRLYLLAALLSNYTNVQRLVFVHGPSRQYVGMAEPKAVCLRIEVALPGLDLAYAGARQQALQNAIQPPVPAMRPARLDVAQIVEQTVWAWPQQVQTFRSIPESEQDERVSQSWLSHTLGADLRWAAISVGGGPDDAVLQYRLLTAQDDFIALLTDDRLTNVVSRCRLAINIATAYLGARLAAK